MLSYFISMFHHHFDHDKKKVVLLLNQKKRFFLIFLVCLVFISAYDLTNIVQNKEDKYNTNFFHFPKGWFNTTQARGIHMTSQNKNNHLPDRSEVKEENKNPDWENEYEYRNRALQLIAHN